MGIYQKMRLGYYRTQADLLISTWVQKANDLIGQTLT